MASSSETENRCWFCYPINAEAENLHQRPQLFLTGTAEGQTREGLSPALLFFGELIKCLGLIAGAIFCCPNSPCHRSSPWALACEASLGIIMPHLETFGEGVNLLGRNMTYLINYSIH